MKQTDEQLAKILEKTLIAATKTGDFIVEQAPDLIQQLLIYKTIDHAVFFILSSVVMYFSIRFIKKEYNRHNDFIDIEPLGVILSVVCIILSAIACLVNLNRLIQIVFAPKVYLIEYAARLLTNN